MIIDGPCFLSLPARQVFETFLPDLLQRKSIQYCCPFRIAFSLWYADRLWKAPTEQDLIEFVIKNPSLL